MHRLVKHALVRVLISVLLAKVDSGLQNSEITAITVLLQETSVNGISITHHRSVSHTFPQEICIRNLKHPLAAPQ